MLRLGIWYLLQIYLEVKKYFDWPQNRRPVHFCCCQFAPFLLAGHWFNCEHLARSSEFSFQLSLATRQQRAIEIWAMTCQFADPPIFESDHRQLKHLPYSVHNLGLCNDPETLPNGSTGNWEGGQVGRFLVCLAKMSKVWSSVMTWQYYN